MKYIEFQNEIISRYNIDICDGDKCPDDWRRTHAHASLRRVCKWERRNSMASTFTLLHEIGHIETSKSTMRRCESEYFATVWALRTAKEYDIKVPDKLIDRYQNYIMLEYSRGIRRGGRLPSPSSFRLPRY